jgi:hypothetical protein
VFKISDLVQPNTGCEGSTVRHPKTGWLFYSGLNEHNLIALRWNMTVYISKVNQLLCALMLQALCGRSRRLHQPC